MSARNVRPAMRAGAHEKRSGTFIFRPHDDPQVIAEYRQRTLDAKKPFELRRTHGCNKCQKQKPIKGGHYMRHRYKALGETMMKVTFICGDCWQQLPDAGRESGTSNPRLDSSTLFVRALFLGDTEMKQT